MKVLGGVPTRNRNTSGAVADRIAGCCERVIIAAEGSCEIVTQNSNVSVLRSPKGLCATRNFLVEMAVEGNYDAVLMADDDMVFRSSAAETTLQILELVPQAGVVTAMSRMLAYFARSEVSNRPWMLTPVPSSVWVMRTDVFRELGYFCLETMEDIEFSLRCWSAGIATITSTKYMQIAETAFSPVIMRMQKPPDSGQALKTRYAELPRSIEYIQSRYGNGVLHHLKMLSNGKRTHSIGYNWQLMCQKVMKRWGETGYEDSRGRKI